MSTLKDFEKAYPEKVREAYIDLLHEQLRHLEDENSKLKLYLEILIKMIGCKNCGHISKEQLNFMCEVDARNVLHDTFSTLSKACSIKSEG